MPETKQNKRLLNPLESDRAIKAGIDPEDEITQLCQAQDAKTLKEVGEWLESHCYSMIELDNFGHWGFIFTVETIEALKQGEMPDAR